MAIIKNIIENQNNIQVIVDLEISPITKENNGIVETINTENVSFIYVKGSFNEEILKRDIEEKIIELENIKKETVVNNADKYKTLIGKKI